MSVTKLRQPIRDSCNISKPRQLVLSLVKMLSGRICSVTINTLVSQVLHPLICVTLPDGNRITHRNIMEDKRGITSNVIQHTQFDENRNAMYRC